MSGILLTEREGESERHVTQAKYDQKSLGYHV